MNYGFSMEPVNGFAPGFVAGFFDSSLPPVSIPDSLSVNAMLALPERSASAEAPGFPSSSTSREEYMAGAERLIDALKRGEGVKAVYSRVILCAMRMGLGEAFARLCRDYPSAYVFCFHTPSTGCWLGASPETLGRCRDSRFSTMSLAGTMASGDSAPWSAKNREEQEIVTRYLTGLLASRGFHVERCETGEKRAGPVKHLCTRIEAKVPEGGGDELMSLVCEMSPTPALCGLPRPWAYSVIRGVERHDRGCYGGLAGLWESSGSFHLWVNLRSLRLSSASSLCALYVGGGLVADSVAEDEYEETCRKSLTLLQSLALEPEDGE